ncbi:MAG: nucleotide exchange factor GrpE [Candidatus Marinimicrobia bacterium]|jgi:molecular chaperone GrpE|nr:nucleotide exchange factor GrpE [Candidatus Neomarinimicrobiota bacterium]|tara:strand:+ start:53 stop:586 length:534 start_codon:yes stop_codon:yes gene_type:complete
MPSKKQTKATNKKINKLTPTEKLKNQINELKSSIDESNDKHIRLKAEFDNYRKRKDKEIISLMKYEGEAVIKQFLNVLDDLERLNQASEKNDKDNYEKLTEGISLIINNIEKQFSKLDVKTFTKLGDILNPELHDALMIRTEDDKHENEIIEIFEKGYLYKDRVIRHAKVVVNQTPS